MRCLKKKKLWNVLINTFTQQYIYWTNGVYDATSFKPADTVDPIS